MCTSCEGLHVPSIENLVALPIYQKLQYLDISHLLTHTTQQPTLSNWTSFPTSENQM